MEILFIATGGPSVVRTREKWPVLRETSSVISQHDAAVIGGLLWASGMWNKATDTVRFEILRVQSHFEIERLIDRATENGFSAEDAIDALEQALEAMRNYRATRAKYPKTPRLF